MRDPSTGADRARSRDSWKRQDSHETSEERWIGETRFPKIQDRPDGTPSEPKVSGDVLVVAVDSVITVYVRAEKGMRYYIMGIDSEPNCEDVQY